MIGESTTIEKYNDNIALGTRFLTSQQDNLIFSSPIIDAKTGNNENKNLPTSIRK